MTPISKLINYIEYAFNRSDALRFNLLRDASGYPMIQDTERKIIVVIRVTEIEVSRFEKELGTLKYNVIIPWDSMTTEQKNRIYELVETVTPLEDDLSDELNEILKDVF